MPRYERTRQARWDDGHLRTVSTRLTRPQAAALDELCHRYGVTKFWLVKRFLLKVLKTAGYEPREAQEEPENELWEELEAAGVQRT